MHWHGIELESYYDGVAGFAGQGRRLAPAIGPGKTFEARFTPPRSGTFIYHTHLDDVRQQRAGLSGALLVLDDPARLRFSPRLGDARHNCLERPADVNPGVPERHQRHLLLVRCVQGSATGCDSSTCIRTDRACARASWMGRNRSGWRIVAKDGMDLPADQLVDADVRDPDGQRRDVRRGVRARQSRGPSGRCHKLRSEVC